jgi:drug/metabolite transporter superfamily protein YnfA
VSTLSVVLVALAAIVMCWSVYRDPGATRYQKSMITLVGMIVLFLAKILMELVPR